MSKINKRLIAELDEFQSIIANSNTQIEDSISMRLTRIEKKLEALDQKILKR